MSRIKTFKMLGIILAIVLIIVGILPIIRGDVLTNDTIATSIILILLGFAYIIITFRPEWTKAVFFFEGIVIGVAGYMILAFPYNIGYNWSYHCCNSYFSLFDEIASRNS